MLTNIVSSLSNCPVRLIGPPELDWVMDSIVYTIERTLERLSVEYMHSV